eukprot:5839209-Pyramimonas_sp.AAC.1
MSAKTEAASGRSQARRTPQCWEGRRDPQADQLGASGGASRHKLHNRSRGAPWRLMTDNTIQPTSYGKDGRGARPCNSNAQNACG